MKRPRFAGFIPDENQSDENEVVEVGLLVRLHWVGVLIGKKGSTIKQLSKVSNAKMMFGDDDLVADQEKYHVMAVSGTRAQIKKACCAIAEKLAEETQSKDQKLVFLVPDAFCGKFIGKKGANVKKMKAVGGDTLWIKLSKQPIELPGASKATTCTVYGPKEDVQKAIEVVAETLGDISSSMKQNMEPEQPPPSYGGGFGQGRGGPPGHGGPRDIRDYGSRGGPPRYGGRDGGHPSYDGGNSDSRGGLPGYGGRGIDNRRGPPDYGGLSRDVREMRGPGERGYGGGFGRSGKPFGRGGDPFEREGGMIDPFGGGFSTKTYGGMSVRGGGYGTRHGRRDGSRGRGDRRGRGKY